MKPFPCFSHGLFAPDLSEDERRERQTEPTRVETLQVSLVHARRYDAFIFTS